MRAVCIALCLVTAAAEAKPRTPPDELIKTLLPRLRQAAECGKRQSAWCVAADGWAAGTAAELPADRTLVGVSVPVRADREVDELLATPASLAAFAVKKDKNGERFGLITDANAKTADEKQLVAKAMSAVSKVLKKEQAKAQVGTALAGWARSLPANAAYAISKTDGEWRMVGKVSDARIRKVGDAWVVIEFTHEQTGPEGFYVSVFTESWDE